MNNQTHTVSRATNTEQLQNIHAAFFNTEAYELGMTFKPQPDDIIISPYAKCGTTLLQQTAHGLRTRGSMDFDEITDVTPWIEVAYDAGWDLEGRQPAKPRLFKSHLSYYDIPKGGRYIISFRHYHDAIVSFYRFFEGWMFESGTISIEELLHWRWPRDEVGSRGYWYHLGSWWEQRNDENILLLCYEDITADLPGTVRKIAKFMDIKLDDELLDIVVRQSSRAFMLKHRRKFDSHVEINAGLKRCGLEPPISTDKVTSGAGNKDQYKLSQPIKQLLDQIWHEQITSKFGLETYEDLRKAIAEINQARF